MFYLICGLLCVVMICLVVIMCHKAADESELMRFHPPDDDDGISLREDDDPDGENQR